ncbi:MAG: hypothetical protein Q9174_001305 [Haloplaca sp. 1 TL-2023]
MASTGTMTTWANSTTALMQRTSGAPTPQSAGKVTAQTPTATPSPGRWRHPKFDEITRRQKASTFDENSVRRVLFNAILMIALFSFRRFLSANPGTLGYVLSGHSQTYLHTSLLYVFLLPIYNIVMALLPIYKGQDNIADIALTPSQRALLGLDPNATPHLTPGTQYVTPPRYARSPTPRNNSPASNRSTPRSRKERSSESPSFGNSFATSNASPLWSQKSGFNASNDWLGQRRSSFGSPSPLGPGKNDSLWLSPSTPSPLAGKGQGAASVGLNSRWLYERGRVGSGRKNI